MDREFLKKTLIFRGMSDDELDAALKSLSAREKKYAREEVILYAGDATEFMGLVLEGSVRIESNDVWGNRSILTIAGRGQFFAETYALLEGRPLLVDAVANENCRVLMVKLGSIRKLETDMSPWKNRLLLNLLNISAGKNLHLSGRSFHTAPKSIRGRVMAYLSSVSLARDSDEFYIPFDRQQLADYLNVERTALSKELGRMQRDGIIEVKKNHFKLLSET